ncbi:hypothetical protein DAPPUDRAFT_346895 [Daphnia pulex]|uniref:Gustatory receptor n=1 Tax=Daphnia pulex TaxID=6669 RepID=E9FST4_DAPPU|nr:hypothetical protein DAPPUDRAFT_346895 [Daphnia pulex]|eukprot:EFX89765.1 hypothetical protein DAPPUDRAFT_346895 [Daphnia pulex]
MAGTLRDRFLLSALSPLNILLQITGVFVNQNSETRWRQRFYRFWTFFLLILAVQSNIYIFVRRSFMMEQIFTYQQINVDRFIHFLVNALIRLSWAVSETIVHLILVFKMWPSVILYLETLETVDFNFGRPNLSPTKRYSLFGLIYVLLTVALNWILSIYWDLNHPVRLVYWLDVLQNSIRILSNHCFTVFPVWIFIICSQLHIFYTRKLIANSKLLNFVVRNATVPISQTDVAQRTFSNLRSLKQLYLAADLLHRQFSTILMVNCFLAFITMLTSSYYVIEFSQLGYVVIVCWEASHVVDSFVRFWLICHTSDRIRESTTECISVLRSLRDTRNAEKLSECNKITSYIIEISQMSKNLERHSLKGVLSVSKRLIIPTLEIIFTYLLIIYQFKSAGNK